MRYTFLGVFLQTIGGAGEFNSKTGIINPHPNLCTSLVENPQSLTQSWNCNSRRRNNCILRHPVEKRMFVCISRVEHSPETPPHQHARMPSTPKSNIRMSRWQFIRLGWVDERSAMSDTQCEFHPGSFSANRIQIKLEAEQTYDDQPHQCISLLHLYSSSVRATPWRQHRASGSCSGVCIVRKRQSSARLNATAMSSNVAHGQSTSPWGSSSTSTHPTLGSSLTDTFGQSRTHYQPGYMMVSHPQHSMVFLADSPCSPPNNTTSTHPKTLSTPTRYPPYKPKQK